jgi:hypothetical protein
MKLYCPNCKDIRETVFKCVEITGRVLKACAICAFVLSMPVDDLHSHGRKPGMPQQARTIVVTSSTTATPSSSTTIFKLPPGMT